MDIQKLIEIVAYILNRNDGQMDYYNLIKECYIADRIAIENTGYAMTGDTYVSMNRGPVLKNLYNLIKKQNSDKNQQQLWNDFFSTCEHKIKLTQDIAHEKLSRFEINVLNDVCQRFYKYSYAQMKEFSHREGVFPEWQFVNKGEEKPIAMEDIMRALKFSEKDIQILINEQLSYEQEKKTLCNLN
ncbi:MAG: SocA family protein [Bacteroidales bacterium]|nr:SocA family protein [Bacteroidales bacterium]